MASSDKELIAVYRTSGRKEALDELLRRHIGSVRAMVFQMVLDHSLADDLTQEVFLRAFRGLAGFRGKSQFSTWLYRVAMNTTRSFLARSGRSPVEFHAEVPERSAEESTRPERAMMQAELASEVETALAELSPKLRAAIVLTGIQHLSTSEAARIEGSTAATMYWRVHEARKFLKRRLEKYLSP